MYRVISAFNDLFDGGFLYRVGDEYPRAGYSTTDQRINELLSDKNKQHKPLIEAVDVDGKTEAARPARKKRGKKNEDN